PKAETAAERVPDRVRNNGGGDRDEKNRRRGNVLLDRQSARHDQNRHGRDGEADLLEENAHEDERQPVLQDRVDQWVHGANPTPRSLGHNRAVVPPIRLLSAATPAARPRPRPLPLRGLPAL